MDFIVVKINGKDLTGASHEEAVQVFQAAQEPIMVEVVRNSSSSQKAKNEVENGEVPEAETLKPIEIVKVSGDDGSETDDADDGPENFADKAIQTQWTAEFLDALIAIASENLNLASSSATTATRSSTSSLSSGSTQWHFAQNQQDAGEEEDEDEDKNQENFQEEDDLEDDLEQIVEKSNQETRAQMTGDDRCVGHSLYTIREPGVGEESSLEAGSPSPPHDEIPENMGLIEEGMDRLHLNPAINRHSGSHLQPSPTTPSAPTTTTTIAIKKFDETAMIYEDKLSCTKKVSFSTFKCNNCDQTGVEDKQRMNHINSAVSQRNDRNNNQGSTVDQRQSSFQPLLTSPSSPSNSSSTQPLNHSPHTSSSSSSSLSSSNRENSGGGGSQSHAGHGHAAHDCFFCNSTTKEASSTKKLVAIRTPVVPTLGNPPINTNSPRLPLSRPQNKRHSTNSDYHHVYARITPTVGINLTLGNDPPRYVNGNRMSHLLHEYQEIDYGIDSVIRHHKQGHDGVSKVKSDDDKEALSWKVKIRPDGTRYITKCSSGSSSGHRHRHHHKHREGQSRERSHSQEHQHQHHHHHGHSHHGSQNQSQNGHQTNGSDPAHQRDREAAKAMRNRMLRERAVQLIKEQGLTTDDDQQSEFKMGKYWPKADRRKHLEKAKERRRKKLELIEEKQKRAIVDPEPPQTKIHAVI